MEWHIVLNNPHLIPFTTLVAGFTLVVGALIINAFRSHETN